MVTPLLLGLYTRFFSDTERLVGPRFSCTVDGDGPPHGLGASVTVGTWNVHGIADSVSGEIDHKRHELSRWIDSCSRRPSLLFVQETWLHADDTLDIDGYTWLGRNRTKISTDPARGSGGVGLLVHDSIAARTRIISEPGYGGSEGVLWVRVDHASGVEFDIYCSVYLEWDRPSFPVDKIAVLDGILSDWPSALLEKPGLQPHPLRLLLLGHGKRPGSGILFRSSDQGSRPLWLQPAGDFIF